MCWFYEYTYLKNMKKALLLLLMTLTSSLIYSQATDLLISEYGEGTSGNSKYIEIYNGTGATVNLANYALWRVTNGGTWPEDNYSFTTGTLADGATLVVGHNAGDVPGADEYDTGFCSWNGNDAVGLVKSGALIDVIGTDGADPGTGWDVAGTNNATANRKITRKATICSPNVNWAASAGTNTTDSEWVIGTYSTGSATAGHVVSCAPSCTPVTIATVFPASGPIGTAITITASSGDLTNATATINGTAVTVVSSSTTQLVIEVPSGATSGDIVITDNQPCDVTFSSFTVITNDATNCDFIASFSELFISEVTDASSGSLTYVEIFNATGVTVDMTNYEVRITNNGTFDTDIPLTGTLAHGDSFIFATSVGSGCGSAGGDGSLADQTDVHSGINNNDCITLRKSGVLIDVWGECDGSNWITTAGLGSAGYDFQRKASATAPSTTFSLADWTTVDFDSCDDSYADIETYAGNNPLPVINTQPTVSLAPCDIATSFTVGASEGVVGGNGLAYQWYVNIPGTVGWTALTDGGVYTGATAATLNISSIIGLNGYQYYCQVREDSATCYVASNTVQLDVTISSVWNGTTWTVAPDISKVVVIDADYDTAVDGSFDACSLIVNAGVQLDIKAGDYVNVINDLTVNGDMQVRHEGSFVQVNDNGLVTLGAGGNIDVRKTTATLQDWWAYTYWSSPVVNETVGNVLGASHPNFRFVFNPTNFSDVSPLDGSDDNGDDWTFTGPTTVMTPGLGYTAMGPTVGSYPLTQDIVFNGAVNNGEINAPISMAAHPDEWNLIGNPYPSAIDIDLFIANNSGVVENTVYLWNHRSAPETTNSGPYVYNFDTDDYAAYNSAMGTGTAANSGGAIPTANIASGQSFFIEGRMAGTAVFNNSMRLKTNNDEMFRVASPSVNTLSSNATTNEINKDLIWLNLENDQAAFNQILVGFVDTALNTEDRFDSKKINSRNISFYSLINDKKFVIQGRQALVGDEEIPLGIESKVSGLFTYRIGIGRLSENFTSHDIYLEDKELNILHDLSLGAYTFELDEGLYNERFALVLKRREILDVEEVQVLEQDIIVFDKDNSLTVNSTVRKIQNITIYDMVGKVVTTVKDVNANVFKRTSANLSKAMYLVTVELDNGQEITKKFIKR